MKITRVTCCVFLLLLSLVAVAFTVGAPRAHATSGNTVSFKFHGLSAVANFDSKSPDGCIETFVYLDGVQTTVHNQLLSSADVFIQQYDFCTNTQLLFASGSTSGPTFQIDKKLLSASLNATIPATDDTGNMLNVSVSVVWTSTSAIGHQNATFHYHTKSVTENGHADTDFRDANASGTVSIGTTNFTPTPAVFAQTMSAKNFDVTITHP